LTEGFSRDKDICPYLLLDFVEARSVHLSPQNLLKVAWI
jgi:hypothetical protein